MKGKALRNGGLLLRPLTKDTAVQSNIKPRLEAGCRRIESPVEVSSLEGRILGLLARDRGQKQRFVRRLSVWCLFCGYLVRIALHGTYTAHKFIKYNNNNEIRKINSVS